VAPGAAAGLSPVVAGAWRLLEWQASVEDTRRWIAERLDLGVTSFDFHGLQGGAAVESLFGQALAGLPGARARAQLIGRCDGDAQAPGRVRQQVQACLRALRTDHLDLLLVHRPSPALDAVAMAQALQSLRDEGLVRQFGVCAADAAQTARLHAQLPLAAQQVELSVLHRQPLADGTLALAVPLGPATLAWSPMAGGRLFSAADAPARALRDGLDALAAELGVPMPVLAIAWIAQQAGRPHPLVGARRLSVVRWALDARALRLEADTLQRLNVVVAPPQR
jgi:predicted oxidoreductase